MNGRAERRALFRLEPSRRTGWGHLARCAALAHELKRRGWRCMLWTSGDISDAPPDLRMVYDAVLPATPEWSSRLPREALACDWIIIDDYGVDDQQLRRLSKAVSPRRSAARPQLLVLDDEGHRRLEAADLIVNTRLGLERSLYAAGVPALLGTSYALLRPELARPEVVVPPFPRDAEGVLVMLGGTDPRGLTPQVIEAIAEVDPVRFCPVVVRAQQSPEADAIRCALDRFAASAWLENLGAASLAGWARCCRFAVSASGGTLYELAYFGLPFVAVVVADNQRPVAAEVDARWRLPVVDVDEDVKDAVASAFRALVSANRADVRNAMANIHIDGRGAARVADVMERTAGTPQH